MRKENLIWVFISFVIIMPLLQFSCTAKGKELNRGNAEKILTNHLQKQNSLLNEYMCKINDTLAKKPDFIQLPDTYFCTFKPTITGIRKTSESTAIVEYRLESIYDKKMLKKILDASEKLQTRYAKLKPISKKQITEEEKIDAGNSFAMTYSDLGFSIRPTVRLIYVWEFKDPAGGDIFFSEVANDEIGDIKKTSLWLKMEHIKRICREYMVIEKRKLEDSDNEAFFVLYDDGWRIVEK